MVHKKKLLDLSKYRNEKEETPKGVVEKNNKTQSSQNKMKLAANKLVTDEDGNEMAMSDWHESLEDGESIQVHCPISPKSHTNGDANPSCTMKRNGDYLNLKCFGCGQSAYYTTIKKKVLKRSKEEFEYTVPSFDKEEALKSVNKNLENLDEILEVMIKYLPKLEKELKDNN